jgi:hypothetical protein
MADSSLVGKLGDQIGKQISGFASGMKGAFVSANPALLGPALGSIEKALKNQTSALRKEQEQRRAERGIAEENANEQRKLYTDILGEQKESNDYLKKILEALLGKGKEDSWWKNLLAPLLALAKALKDGFNKLLKALEKLFDLIKAFKLGDLFKNFKLRIGKFLDDIAKFFKELPGKFAGWLSDLAKFFKNLPGKFAGWLGDLAKFFKNLPARFGALFDDLAKLLKYIPAKLGGWIDDLIGVLKNALPETTKAIQRLLSNLSDIFKFEALKGAAQKLLQGISDGFSDLIKLIRESNLGKAFGSLIDDIKALPAEFAGKIRAAVKAIQESDLVKYIDELFGSIKASFAKIPVAISTGLTAISDSIKSMDFVKSANQLGDTISTKFATLTSAIDTKFTAIADAIKGSAVGKAAATIADDLANIGRSFVSDIRTKLPSAGAGAAGVDPDLAARAKAAMNKPGFERTADDLVAIRAYEQATDVTRQVPDITKVTGSVADATSTLQKLQNLIPEGLMKVIDSVGEALGKVFGFVKSVGDSIVEGTKGLGRFLASITDLDVMMKVIGKFVKALPIIGWVFTTIDGLQAAFDTAGLAETLGKAAEDVTLADRLKGFVGGFFGSFFGIIDFFAKLMTGEETTMQKDMTAAITKLTDEIAGQIMDFFRFWGGILTSEPMMAIYKFIGSYAKIAFETIGSSLKSVIELMVGILTFNPDKMIGGIKGLYDSFMRGFTATFELIGATLKAPISKLVNIMIGAFESSINFFIDAFNSLVEKLKSMEVFGVRIGAVFDNMKGFERASFNRMDEGAPKPSTASATPTASAPQPATTAAPPAVTNRRPSAPAAVTPVPGVSIPGEATSPFMVGASYSPPSGQQPLSVRNNNPGNLRYYDSLTRPGYVLEGATRGEGGFARFDTPEAGMRAMYQQLRIDTQRSGLTLSQFINKYAPPSENKTGNYINFVGAAVGLKPNDKIPESLLPDVMRAMVQMEGGSKASSYYYGGGNRNPNIRPVSALAGGSRDTTDYANYSDIQGPTTSGGEPPPKGTEGDPVTIEQVLSAEDKERELERVRREEESIALMEQQIAIAQEEANRNEERDARNREEAAARVKAENERFRQERENLYKQFNQTARSIYEGTLRSAIGNLGVTGPQAFMMGGSSIIDKYLGASFKSLGEKLFGKQQGGGMGMIFQKLLGSYANQAVNQVIAPALGMDAGLLNRALNNFAQGNKKEAYADLVFGMTGVATDARTFLESITGKKGIDTAIGQFSQTLADISTGPLAGMFAAAPDGMGMYKVDAGMDPFIAGPAMGANMLLEGAKASSRLQFEAAKTSSQLLVTGAQTAAKIDEASAKDAGDALARGATGQGQQGKGFFGAIFDGFKNLFGRAFGGTSGTTPGGGPANEMEAMNEAYIASGAPGSTMVSMGGANPFANLIGYTKNFAGFTLGSAIGRGLGLKGDTLGSTFLQAGINNISGNFMNSLFTGGPGAAMAGLSNLGTMLMAGKFSPTGLIGSGLGKFGTQIGSQALTDFGGGLSGSAFGGGSSFSQMFGANSTFGSASFGAQAGAVMGAIGNAALAYSLQSMLSGGYKSGAGKAVAAIGSFFDPTGGFIAGTVGAVVNRLFGRKAPEVTGQGITGTLATGSGTNLQNYAEILEKGGKYRSDKRYTQYTAADAEFVKSIQNAVNDSTKIVEDSAKALSLDSSSFRNFTKDVKIELKGLSAEQQKKAIEDMLVGYTEDMLTSVYPQITQYRKEIEGKLETNVDAFRRLANATVAADNAFRMLGYTAEEITDVLGMAITDTATRLAAANVKSQMTEAFGGDQKMQATLQNYLGKVYSPEKLEKIKLDMAKSAMADIVKENTNLTTILDVTKYSDLQAAKDAHLAAFDAAMKAGDFKTANALASSYDTFIEGVRLSIRAKAKEAAGENLPGVTQQFVDESLGAVTYGEGIRDIVAMQAVAESPIVSAITGQAIAGEASIGGVGYASAVASGTTGAYLSEQYGGMGPYQQGGGTTNNSVIDNSTVIASRPTSITVMRDDNVRDYHPILGSSNRGLSGGYGWGNDYQGSFGAG